MLTVAFILSTRRAGSTWLNVVLGSHSAAANLGEYSRPFEDRSHVECRLCEANGLAECTVLGGIEAIAIEYAYTFASARMEKNILIDCSKLIHWAERFMQRPGLDARLIHLVRHPCGYVEGEARRRPEEEPAKFIAEWIEQNTRFDTFIAQSGRPNYLVNYDKLADAPLTEFPALCEFIGFPFEPAALDYWNFEHHGLGGNGANSIYLRNRKVKNYVTGDDEYYADLASRSTAADVRWRNRLPADVCEAAISSDYAQSMARRLEVSWEPQ
jgi:hypothetical protein